MANYLALSNQYLTLTAGSVNFSITNMVVNHAMNDLRVEDEIGCAGLRIPIATLTASGGTLALPWPGSNENTNEWFVARCATSRVDSVYAADQANNANSWQARVLGQATPFYALSTENTPPASPTTGDRHLVGTSPTDDFVGLANKVVEYRSGGWVPTTPRIGDFLHDLETSLLLLWNGTAWNPSGNLAFVDTTGDTMTGVLAFSGTGHAGLRLNNLTSVQRDAIVSPGVGALIWNTTTEKVEVRGASAWAAVGTGDVVGPVSATDNAIARFDLTTGKLLQNSVVTISDAGAVAGVDSLNIGTGAADNPFVMEKSQNSSLWARLRNPNAGALATVGLLLGGDGSAAQASIFVNSNAKTDFGGLGSINIGNYGAAGVGFFTNGAHRGGFSAAGDFTVGTAAYHTLSQGATDATHRMHVSGGATGWSAGLNRPGAAAGVNMVWSSYASSTWTDRMRLYATGTWELPNAPTTVAVTGTEVGAMLIRGGAGTGEYNSLSFATTGGSPVARIAGQISGSGSSLHFGVSNNYGLGVSHNVMTIRYDQRVGINTTAPAAPLDVRGPGGSTVLQVSDGLYGTFSCSFSSSYGIEFGSAAGSNINLKANNLVGLTVNTTGQVGIGPGGLGATPGYALDVRDTNDNVMRIRGGGANALAWLMRADNGGTAQEYQFGVTKTTHGWGAGFYLYSNTAARRDLFIDSNGSMTIGGGATHVMSVGGADVTHRQIISGGATGWSVGLNRPGDSAGTTLTWASYASATWTTRMSLTTTLLTLTTPLSIGTSAARVNPASGYSITNYGQGNSFWLFGANTNFISGIHFGDPADDDVGKIEYAHNGDYMSFWTNAAERMRINSSGSVGLGTTTLNALAVARTFSIGDATAGNSVGFELQTADTNRGALWANNAYLVLSSYGAIPVVVKYNNADRIVAGANTIDFAVPPKLPSYTVGTVPNAATAGAGAEIYVSNEAGGATVAFSDGTNWRKVHDRAVIS